MIRRGCRAVTCSDAGGVTGEGSLRTFRWRSSANSNGSCKWFARTDPLPFLRGSLTSLGCRSICPHPTLVADSRVEATF
jgi:hypothetical protein